MGVCVSNHSENTEVIVKNFEKTLPMVKMPLADYEERVKRLVFADDDDQIAIVQLKESFRDVLEF